LIIKRPPIKSIAKELFILAGLAMLAAVMFNYFSPKGISLVDCWNFSECEDTTTSAVAAAPYGYEVGDVYQAKQIFDSGLALFVDARSSEFFANGHIKGAVSLPLVRFEERIDSFKKQYAFNVEIITYCYDKGCNDGNELAWKLTAAGYTRVRYFPEGLVGWEGEGYPVE
jgi:rhodanese-related sulfurtransferase